MSRSAAWAIMTKNRTFRISLLTALVLISGLGVAQAAPSDEDYPLKPLRDPFWPVGYFPENWQTAGEADTGPTSVSDWDAPAALVRVSGTSRMGAQTAAIINGEVKAVGDLVEVHYSGRIYQWKLIEVQPTGKVKLERFAVKTDTPGFQKETTP